MITSLSVRFSGPALLCQSFSALLAETPDLRVERDEAAVLVAFVRPDATMECAHAAADEAPPPATVLFVLGDHLDFGAAIDRGARAFLTWNESRADLVEAVQRAAGGHAYFSPSLQDDWDDALRRARQPAPQRAAGPLAKLTPRQRDIVDLALQYQTNTEIATALCISVATVKTHLEDACHRLKVRGRPGLFRLLRGGDAPGAHRDGEPSE